jgi:hypothetical protein
LVRILHDCSQSQPSSISISNYFTKQSSSCHDESSCNGINQSDGNTENDIKPGAPPSEGKRTAIKNLYVVLNESFTPHIYQCTGNKIKNNKNNTVGTVPKSNKKFIEIKAELIPLMHIYMTAHILVYFLYSHSKSV